MPGREVSGQTIFGDQVRFDRINGIDTVNAKRIFIFPRLDSSAIAEQEQKETVRGSCVIIPVWLFQLRMVF